MSENITFLLSFLFLLTTCSREQAVTLENEYNLIPYPSTLTPGVGQFVFDENTSVYYDRSGESQGLLSLVDYCKEQIQEITNNRFPLEEGKKGNFIIFQLNDSIVEKEGYILEVRPNRILVKAKNKTGLFYGIQTIKQLMFKLNVVSEESWAIPCVDIRDAPRFSYRGMHLDVVRHFFGVDVIKRFIDQLAYHKLNYFHWHLTDDQGWRIEIKKYPKLTEIGAFRNGTLIGHYNDQPHQFDGQRYGGFYTQEDIKEVVQYAADRFVTVVPEIEMPGHAQAAIAAYPELGCVEGDFEVWQKWGISDNVYCPKETTFQFLEDVIDEVIELFPGKYIHIGGDECPKTKWKESAFCQQLMKKEGLKDEHELQSYFIRRMETYINSKGRQIIGWNEILEGGLAPNASVMSWQGIKGGIEAAKSGHDVVMTPTSFCYLDYYQSDHPDEPLAIGGLLPLEKIYSYEPIPEELTTAEAKHILGAQGNLWTEYIPTVEKLEYMAFPRLSALAEVVWSPKEARNFENFIPRVTVHIQRLEAMGFHPANHLYELNSSIQPHNGNVEVKLSALAKDPKIYYTLDGSQPSIKARLYTEPIIMKSDATIKAQSFLDGKAIGRVWEQDFLIHKAAGKKIDFLTQPHPKYSGGGNGSVINGVLGNNERYGDAEWLGFNGEDFEAVINFKESTAINKITFRFFKGEGQWIYLPSAITLWSSNDGGNYKEITKKEDIAGDSKVVESSIELENVHSQYLKIKVHNFGLIPQGRQGGGNPSFLFVDEIVVE